ncbi:probable cationic amino acid transporter [Schistocerca nitens]|uniref:probable cationic amino acid transporter n=1 Tax=Schistocerca nitens TaxID=7011 RepID=UPI0021192A85|nr:probable cationic amino acid transporter [Schistocerca nitens]
MKLNLGALGNVDRAELKRDGLTLFSRLIRTKNVESMQGDAAPATKGAPAVVTTRSDDHPEKKLKLKKCLTTLDLTSLGVGSCVGTGMYLVAGMVAKSVAGPGVIFSFIIAAIASIFSGACYAEFGVRVPHTTGSAYMYSYVTVGELVAFVIGWNMVLEYLIGTAACACALSACLDALAGGAVSRGVASSVGTMFGRPPDFLACLITLLMTLVMAAGVKKSLIFNNVLNAINLAVWVFIMSAGLFYVDGRNWSESKGFLPFGWSGVLTGAATCFYAFIGFDIIATTGEEATNPRRSIPLAIVASLIVILIAYVTSSMMLTLIVPYNKVDADSALVEMFGQVGAYKCKCIVAVGALAGLTVSMFGSMFPMPRIVYAMAQDGLIFRTLSRVWQATGTPAIATFSSGVAAALAALLIQLEVLVEMMSIGTLLAYTLVSTCVLILRYQPHSTNLVELLPQSLRTPIRGSPTKENLSNGQVLYGNQLQPDQLRAALGGSGGGGGGGATTLGAGVGVVAPGPPLSHHGAHHQRVMVRRVTRRYSSPDSDDTYPGEEPEEDLSMRDDQFLVSDRSENKFYGSLHGAGGGGGGGLGLGLGGGSGLGAGVSAPGLGYIGRRLHAATYLCPAIFPWVDTGPATEESGMFVMKMVGVLYVLILTLDITVAASGGSGGSWLAAALSVTVLAIIGVLLAISRKPQNRKTLLFMTPGLPFVPAVAVTVNIYLIFKLSILTLVRFTVWMAIGFGVYFYYGIKHSTLEEEEQQRLREEQEEEEQRSVSGIQGGIGGGSDTGGGIEMSVSPARQTPQVPVQTAGSAPVAATGRASDLFVPPTHFPTWDD